MNNINSKDVVIIIMGIILTALIGLIIKISGYNLEKLEINNIFQNLLLIIPVIIAIVVIFYMKLNEINKELDNQKSEQQKLVEKLKIHEQLIDMKAEVKELQKKVFKK
jgi:glucan phosphoethanolaminetransferase (alkaline phosphatase superfamily)